MDLESFNAIKEQNQLLEKQNTILQSMLDMSSYSHAPFSSLLQTELHSYEDMDGNSLLFCIDFIFNVPFHHLSPMIQSACAMYWPSDEKGTTEQYYDAYRATPGTLKLLTFDDYKDSVQSPALKARIQNYINNYQRLLAAHLNEES